MAKNFVFLNTNATMSLDYCTLGQIRREIDRYIEKYGEDSEIRMECEPYCGEKEYPTIYHRRLETDDEYAVRLENERKQAQLVEARERKEFERLQAKFVK